MVAAGNLSIISTIHMYIRRYGDLATIAISSLHKIVKHEIHT